MAELPCHNFFMAWLTLYGMNRTFTLQLLLKVLNKAALFERERERSKNNFLAALIWRNIEIHFLAGNYLFLAGIKGFYCLRRERCSLVVTYDTVTCHAIMQILSCYIRHLKQVCSLFVSKHRRVFFDIYGWALMMAVMHADILLQHKKELNLYLIS